jgi:Zinc carboxypeptidase/Secretion system C-terminal sorting domain
MIEFMEGLPLVLAANFHGGIEVVNYPWDIWSRWHADDAWYRRVARKYADAAQTNGEAGYMNDLDNGITNGNAWYLVYGSRQDFTNYFLHAREVTIELSGEKMPAESSLESYWQANRQSLLQFIGQSLTGIRGTVIDSVSGMPLKAEISIRYHDFDNSEVLSSASDGNYYRMLVPGYYPMIFTAPGYRQDLYYVDIHADTSTVFNVKLSPFFIHFNLYPNPFTDLLKIYVPEPGNNLSISFTDVTGRRVKIIDWPVTSAGVQEIEVNSLSPGIYIAGITYGTLKVQQVLVKAGSQ